MFQRQLPFVGRDADLRLLELVLTRAAAGTGSVVLISGEAGIGKTRLCQELSRSHRGRGGQVLLGRAFPEDAAIAFGAIADTLRAARRSEPPLWQAALARGSVLWAIAPELAAAHEVERRSFDRPVLFEALLDAVDEATGDRVTLWVLDDLHWADEATWAFVRYAARRIAEMGLVLGVTYREEELGAAHPWWASLVRLRRDPSVMSVSLERLSAAEGERLVRALAPSLPQGLVATIIQRSAGTPLLVQELAGLASRSGALPDLPDIVRATVQQRTARLGPAARDLLEVAAVAGLEVEEELLASLRPASPADELVSAGLLEREGAHLRFRHPLLQEAAYRDVPPERRRAIHQELAEALARSGAHPVERVAGHLERAGHPQAALSVLEESAAEAGKAGNVGRSATLHLAALQLAGRQASLAPRRAGLQELAIRELFLAGRWTELDPLVRDAWSRRDRLPLHQRAWLANVLAVHLFWTGEVGEARALIEQELAHLEHHDALDQGAMLLAQAGFVAGFLGERQQALRHSERALESARRTGDVQAECRARYTQIYILYGLDRDRQAAIARARDTAAFARAHGLPASEAAALFSMAEYTTRIEDAEAAQQAAERAGAWDYANLAQLLRGVILLFQGRADEAEAVFVRVGPEIRFSRPASPVPWVDTAEALLHLHRGDLEEARRILHRPGAGQAARSTVRVADRAAALGWLAWEEGRWEDAAEQLADPMESWVGGWHLMVGGPCACHCTSTRSCGWAGPPMPRPSSRRRRPCSASRRASRRGAGGGPVPTWADARAGRPGPVADGRGALAVAWRAAWVLARRAARGPAGGARRTCAVRADRRRPWRPPDRAGPATPGCVAAQRRWRGHSPVASRAGGGRTGGRRPVEPRDRPAAVPEPPDHRAPRGPHPDQAGLCLTGTDRRVGGPAAQRRGWLTADRVRPHGPAEPFAQPPGRMIHPADVGEPLRMPPWPCTTAGRTTAARAAQTPPTRPLWHRVDLTERHAMILVTGATGTIGRPLIDALVSEGAKVRAVTRNPQAAGLPAGVEVVQGDPAQPDTIAPFLEGVTALFLHPRAVGIPAAADLLALARQRGVQRVVALSAMNVDDPLNEQPSRYNGDRNKEVEDATVASGLDWVSLRASSFAMNTLLAWGAQIRAGDIVRYPYASFAEALIHERDLAEVGARALLTDALVGRRPALTGPQSLTHEQMVAIIGEVLGRPLRYQELPPEVAEQGMVQQGLPEPFVQALLARYARDVGQPAPVTSEVERILGRPALTYAEWAADHAAAFRAPAS